MRSGTVTFAVGPAGTGKTYLAVATAVRALEQKQVSRLILTRPAVEAGERLGFLPGTLYEKIDPYMKPLYDALFEMMGADALPRLMERGTVEVAPLAYMRGRTLNDSFIILDEAQNTTPEQMKMFLTRLGFGSKAVVNGDVTQIDLPTGQTSGLVIVAGDPPGHRGDRGGPPRRPRRRPAQDRAGHRGGVPRLRRAACPRRWLTTTNLRSSRSTTGRTRRSISKASSRSRARPCWARGSRTPSSRSRWSPRPRSPGSTSATCTRPARPTCSRSRWTRRRARTGSASSGTS